MRTDYYDRLSVIPTLKWIEKFWRANPALRKDLQPRFIDLKRNIVELHDLDLSPSGPLTSDQQSHLNGYLVEINTLCRELFFGVDFDAIYKSVLENKSPEDLIFSGYRKAEDLQDRKSYWEERSRLIDRREALREDLKSYSASAREGQGKTDTAIPSNLFLIRALEQTEQRITQLQQQHEPPAWFDIRREITLPDKFFTEQPIRVSIHIFNRGREDCSIIYTENIPPNVEIITSQHWENSENSLTIKSLVSAGREITYSYTCSILQLGDITFTGELHHDIQKPEWKPLLYGDNAVSCKNKASTPQISVERFYRYLESRDTEILLKISNEAACRIARGLSIRENYTLGNVTKIADVKISFDKIYPGEEPLWVSYIIKGRHEIDSIQFDQENCIFYQDEGKSICESVNPECKLFKYQTLHENKIEVTSIGRQYIRQTQTLTDQVKNTNSCHVLYITGPSGTGKSGILSELRKQSEQLGFYCFNRTVERNSNAIREILVEMMGLRVNEPLDPAHVDEFLDIAIKEESKEIYKSALKNYLLSISVDYNPNHIVEAIRIIIGYIVGSSPVLLTFDNAHEIHSTSELELIRDILSRLVNSSNPMIIAFSEISGKSSLHQNLVNYLPRGPQFSMIETRTLTPDETNNLIDELIVYPKISDSIRKFVIEVAKGVPQYVKDVLQWLIESNMSSVGLSGDYWVKEIWQPKDQIAFSEKSETLEFLPLFAKNQLSYVPDGFGYLQILSVVGEIIPFNLAQLLHQSSYQTTDSLTEKIQGLKNINFIRISQSGDLEFSHFSRWYAIYHDKATLTDEIKINIRKQIITCILEHPETYPNEDERTSQIAHHLVKCDEEFQETHFDILIDATRREFRRKNAFLSQLYANFAIKLLKKRVDTTALDLYLSLAQQTLVLKHDYSIATKYLADAKEYLVQIPPAKVPHNVRDFYQGLIDKLEAKILLQVMTLHTWRIRNSGLKTSKIAVDFASSAFKRLSNLHPRKFPIISKPLQGFRYDELFDAHLVYAQALLKANEEKAKAGESHTYGYLFFANEKIKNALKLTDWLDRKKGMDEITLLNMYIELADEFMRQGKKVKAQRIYESLSNRIKKREQPKRESQWWKLITKNQHPQWRFTLRTIAVITWVVSALWLIVDISFEPLIALLSGTAFFLGSFAINDKPTDTDQVAKEKFAHRENVIQDFDNSHPTNLWFQEGRILQRLAQIRVNETNKDLPGIQHDAISIYETAIELHAKSGDISASAESHRALGDLYREQDASNKALLHFESGRRLSQECGYARESWLCCCGALEILIERGEFHSCDQIWDQAYHIYERHVDTEQKNVIYTELIRFVKIAENLTRHYEIQEDWTRGLQTVDVQLNNDIVEDPSFLYSLFNLKGRLHSQLHEMQPALSAYIHCLRLTKIHELADECIIETRQHLSELYESIGFSSEVLPEPDIHSVWNYYEPEFHLEQNCIIYAQKGNSEAFANTYSKLLHLVSDDALKLGRFPRSYLVVLRHQVNLTQFNDLIDLTLRVFLEKGLASASGDLLVYTSLLLLGPGNDKKSPISFYLERAEDSYMHSKNANLRQLMNLFLGYSIINYADGLGRAILWLLDEVITQEDIEGYRLLFDKIITMYILRKTPVRYLICIRERVHEMILLGQRKNHPGERQFLDDMVQIQQALGEKYNSKKEIARKLVLVKDIMNTQVKISSFVYNQFGLGFSTLNQFPKAAVVYQQAALMRYRSQPSGRNYAVSLDNLISAYLKLDLYNETLPILITAYNEIYRVCLALDNRTEFPLSFTEEVIVEKLNEIIDVRRILSDILAHWQKYLQEIDKVSVLLSLFKKEQNIVDTQLRDASLLGPLNAPIKLPYQLDKKAFEEGLTMAIPGAPTIEEILVEIDSMK